MNSPNTALNPTAQSAGARWAAGQRGVKRSSKQILQNVLFNIMSKKRNKNKRKKQLRIRNTERSDVNKKKAMDVLGELDFEITDEPIYDEYFENLPKSVQDQLNDLYDKSQVDPRLAINELTDLLSKYPHIPQIYNYLYTAYMYSGDKTNAIKIMRRNYEENPSYLFAKLNYSDYLMESGEYNKVEEIFSGILDLKELYPDRNIFHVTEVISFYGVVGYYLAMTGKYSSARQFLRILNAVSPLHGYTFRLRDKIDNAGTLFA